MRTAVAGKLLDDFAGRVHVPPALRRPEQDRRQRIAQSFGEDVADLLGRPRAFPDVVLERLHMPNALVAVAGEAPVDAVLDPRAQRPERQRHREGRSGHDPLRAATRDDPEHKRDSGVGRGKQEGEH